MTEAEVRRLLAAGESLTVEFKNDATRLPDADWIATVVCMANHQGGTLLVGVEDDGAITGLHSHHKTSPSAVAAFIASRTVPPLMVEVHFLNVSEGMVAVLSIPALRHPVATSEGKLLIRYSDTHGNPGCRPLHPHELTGWRADRSMADFSALTVPEASWDDFDPLEFVRLRRLAEENRGDKALLELADKEVARALGLVSNETATLTPTLAGLLLIGKEGALRKYLPAHEVAFQVLRGTEVAVNEFRRWPLLRVYEWLMQALEVRNEEQELMHKGFRIGVGNGGRRSYRLGSTLRINTNHTPVAPLEEAEIESQLIAYIQRQGRIRREEVETLSGWSRAQAYRWLKRAIAAGKLRQSGRGRSVYYKLASSIN